MNLSLDGDERYLIPEDAECLHGGELLIPGLWDEKKQNRFEFFVTAYTVMGTGFSPQEAIKNAWDQIQRKKNSFRNN